MPNPTTAADFLRRAHSAARAEFIAASPYYFLVGIRPPALAPRQPHRTEVNWPAMRTALPRSAKPVDSLFDSSDEVTALSPQSELTEPPGRPGERDDDGALLIYAVRKVQETFPSMITVGRTANNDLVVPAISVSKFHAFFRLADDHVELHDAGSRNGTYIGEHRLEPKVPGNVLPGDLVRFADVRLAFVTAGECWDWIRNPRPV